MSILRAVSSDDLDLVKELNAISQARRQARRDKAHEKAKEDLNNEG